MIFGGKRHAHTFINARKCKFLCFLFPGWNGSDLLSLPPSGYFLKNSSILKVQHQSCLLRGEHQSLVVNVSASARGNAYVVLTADTPTASFKSQFLKHCTAMDRTGMPFNIQNPDHPTPFVQSFFCSVCDFPMGANICPFYSCPVSLHLLQPGPSQVTASNSLYLCI